MHALQVTQNEAATDEIGHGEVYFLRKSMNFSIQVGYG